MFVGSANRKITVAMGSLSVFAIGLFYFFAICAGCDKPDVSKKDSKKDLEYCRKLVNKRYRGPPRRARDSKKSNKKPGRAKKKKKDTGVDYERDGLCFKQKADRHHDFLKLDD